MTIVASVAVMWIPARWPTTVPEVAAFTLAALWVAAFLAGRERPQFTIALVPLTAAVAWAIFQLAIGATVYRWRTGVAVLYWAGNLATFFVGLQTFADSRTRALFLRALTIFGFLISLISILQRLTANGLIFWLFPTNYPAMGPFVYSNQYAAFVELLLPIPLNMALVREKFRYFNIIIVGVLYASVLTSTSRAGSILTTLELFVVPFLAIHQGLGSRRKTARVAALLAGSVTLLICLIEPFQILDKFGQKDPYAGRREFVYSSVRMIKDKPFLGVGLGNWSAVYPGYALFDDGLFTNQAHNDWAQWTVEGGVPFTAMMLWVAAWGISRGLRAGWGAGIAALYLHCLVDYPIQRTAVSIVLFALLAAVAYPSRQRLERSRN